MNQKYFAIVGNNLKVLHLESIRIMFYQIAGLLLIVFIITTAFEIIVHLCNKLSVSNSLMFWNQPVFAFVFLIIPVISIIIAHRFPPAPEVIFHSDSQTATWKSGNNRLVVPFSTIHFATSRLLSKSGISTVMVAVFAIADKPFFLGDPSSDNPDMRYRKDLCIYKAGTQAEADESIEIVKSFMAGRYNESPEKFDNL